MNAAKQDLLAKVRRGNMEDKLSDFLSHLDDLWIVMCHKQQLSTRGSWVHLLSYEGTFRVVNFIVAFVLNAVMLSACEVPAPSPPPSLVYDFSFIHQHTRTPAHTLAQTHVHSDRCTHVPTCLSGYDISWSDGVGCGVPELPRGAPLHIQHNPAVLMDPLPAVLVRTRTFAFTFTFAFPFWSMIKEELLGKCCNIIIFLRGLIVLDFVEI
jgi:hypothetical protein